jgi:hypothetical protein
MLNPPIEKNDYAWPCSILFCIRQLATIIGREKSGEQVAQSRWLNRGSPKRVLQLK